MDKKTALIILDGWGIGAKDDSDGVHLAKTPFFDHLMKNYPNAQLKTFGKEVGLPDGPMVVILIALSYLLKIQNYIPFRFMTIVIRKFMIVAWFGFNAL